MAEEPVLGWYCGKDSTVVQPTVKKECLQNQAEQPVLVPSMEEHTFNLSPEYSLSSLNWMFSNIVDQI